jgi:hypothetical protein
VFTYAQAFYGHIPAAVCIVGAYACIVLRDTPDLSNRRLIAIGALLGTAVLLEYPAAFAGLPIALWALALARGRAVLGGLLGALPPLAILAIYDWLAFGTPFPVGYQHSALWQEQHDTGFLSLTRPHWDAIWGISFSPFRGLFFYAPVLLLSVIGTWVALRMPRQRVATLVALASFVAMFLFVSSSAMWWGGFAVGPRYLLPALPMLAIPIGVLIARINAQASGHRFAGLGVVGFFAVVSATLVMATTFAGQGYPPDAIRHPLAHYVLPALRDGNIARNVGMALNLNGVLSLFPLMLMLGFAFLLIGHALLVREASPQ